MSHSDDTSDHDHDAPAGGTVSEGGSGALNDDTSLGGADSVPDTPDINDTGEQDGIDISEQSQEDAPRP